MPRITIFFAAEDVQSGLLRTRSSEQSGQGVNSGSLGPCIPLRKYNEYLHHFQREVTPGYMYLTLNPNYVDTSTGFNINFILRRGLNPGVLS